jgi:hypothetical protein
MTSLVRAPAPPAQYLGEASEGAVEAPSDLMEEVHRVVTIAP